MNIPDTLGIKEESFITMVGGGGKTTGLFLLATLLKNSVVTTSTKMYKPPIDPDIPFTYSKREGDKYYGLTVQELEILKEKSSYKHILCEGDGARMRPLKVWKEGEPIIPPSTTHTIINIGAKALGRPWGKEWVHRSELLPFDGRRIDFSLLIEMANLGVFSLQFPRNSKVYLVFNQWDLVDEGMSGKVEAFAKHFKSTLPFVNKVVFVSYAKRVIYSVF